MTKKPKKKKPAKKMKYSPKDRYSMVRDEMAKYPRVDKYGYSRDTMKRIFDKYGVRMTEASTSRMIKRVEEDWEAMKGQVVTRRKLLSTWLNLYADCDKIFIIERRIKRKAEILQEIGKIEKHYETLIKTTHGIEGIPADELQKLLEAIDK